MVSHTCFLTRKNPHKFGCPDNILRLVTYYNNLNQKQRIPFVKSGGYKSTFILSKALQGLLRAIRSLNKTEDVDFGIVQLRENFVVNGFPDNEIGSEMRVLTLRTLFPHFSAPILTKMFLALQHARKRFAPNHKNVTEIKYLINSMVFRTFFNWSKFPNVTSALAHDQTWTENWGGHIDNWDDSISMFNVISERFPHLLVHFKETQNEMHWKYFSRNKKVFHFLLVHRLLKGENYLSVTGASTIFPLLLDFIKFKAHVPTSFSAFFLPFAQFDLSAKLIVQTPLASTCDLTGPILLDFFPFLVESQFAAEQSNDFSHIPLILEVVFRIAYKYPSNLRILNYLDSREFTDRSLNLFVRNFSRAWVWLGENPRYVTLLPNLSGVRFLCDDTPPIGCILHYGDFTVSANKLSPASLKTCTKARSNFNLRCSPIKSVVELSPLVALFTFWNKPRFTELSTSKNS